MTPWWLIVSSKHADSCSDSMLVSAQVLLTYKGQNLAVLEVESKWAPNKVIDGWITHTLTCANRCINQPNQHGGFCMPPATCVPAKVQQSCCQ